MTAYSERHSVLPRSVRVIALVAALGGPIGMTGCVDDLLDVDTPDIVIPDDAKTPAGANAVRIGALARFVQATTGTESLFLLGGLMADEFVNGDTFIARHELDRRSINFDNTFLQTASRNLHRALLSAAQAIELVNEYNVTAPAWHTAEMEFIQAYLVNLAAEHYCDGLVFSTVEDGVEQYGVPITTDAAYDRALAHANAGIALLASATDENSLRVLNALRVARGRILMNQNDPAGAAAAVADVPTTFAYSNLHSANTFDNAYWTWNNSARRYSVSDAEGINGLNFATADDPRVPVCLAPCAGVTQGFREDASQPLYVQTLYPDRSSPAVIVDGIAARLIEAEAQLRAGGDWLGTLNSLRESVTGLDPLDDPGTDAARLALLFRERAFWQFARGTRFGELRRLVRQYSMPESQVWPTGAWHKAGGTYSSDVTIPVPLDETNNPNIGPGGQLCMNRNA